MMTQAEKSAEQARWLAEEEAIELRAQNKALLEALQSVAAYCGHNWEDGEPCNLHPYMNTVRAAIAQATNNDDVETMLAKQGEQRRQLGRDLMGEQS